MRVTDPKVAAIFTGHTHKEYAWSAPIPGTDRTRPVVQTGSYGANLGKITLTIDAATGDVQAHTETIVKRTTTPAATLTATYPRVAEVDGIVKQALAAAAEVGNTAVGEVAADITTAFAGGSQGEPVVAGELSVRYLGVALESWAPDATPCIGEVGEMVVTAPMPSMSSLVPESGPRM